MQMGWAADQHTVTCVGQARTRQTRPGYHAMPIRSVLPEEVFAAEEHLRGIDHCTLHFDLLNSSPVAAVADS